MNKLLRYLVRIALAIPMYRLVFKLVYKRKMFIRRQQMSLIYANKFRVRFLLQIKKYGPNYHQRLVTQIREAITYEGLLLHEFKERHATKAMHWLLNKINLIEGLCGKLTVFSANIHWLINQAENGYKQRKQLELVFKNDIWKLERMKIWEYMAGKVNAEFDRIKSLIVATPPDSEEIIQDLYIRRQKLYCNCQFMDWYIHKEYHQKTSHNKGHQFTEKFYSYRKKLPEYQEQVEILDEFFDKDIPNFKLPAKRSTLLTRVPKKKPIKEK